MGHHHEHDHEHCHHHDHGHEHCHHHDHGHEHCQHDHEHCQHHHDHDHDHAQCQHHCGGCHNREHTPMDELVALMKYMVGHNASHAKELADLAAQLEKIGSRMAYEQVMAAVSDFEKGNMRLQMVLSSLEVK